MECHFENKRKWIEKIPKGDIAFTLVRNCCTRMYVGI